MTRSAEQHIQNLMLADQTVIDPVSPDFVVALGHRIRRRRAIRTSAVVAVFGAMAAAGSTAIFVPAAGNPLTTTVWAIGEGTSISETGPWMSAGDHLYVMTIRQARLGERAALVISTLRPDGSSRDLSAMSVGPELPMVGMAVSTEPGASYALFPAGAHDIQATVGGAPASISTMRISSPLDGPDYVAVTVSAPSGLDQTPLFTWSDSRGERHFSP